MLNQIVLKIDGKQKRCNINTTITPFLVNKINEIEFEWFYKANREWLETMSISVKDAIDESGKTHQLNSVSELYSTPQKAYNVYLSIEDITRERCFKQYKYEIIVPVLKLVLNTNDLSDQEKELVGQDYELTADNFWANQDTNELKKFYVELKKSID